MEGLDSHDTLQASVQLTWGTPINQSLQIERQILESSAFFSQTLKLDPECKELSMPSYETYSIQVTTLVLEFHRKVLRLRPLNLKGFALSSTSSRETFLGSFLQQPEIGLELDLLTKEPGILRVCCDVGRVLMLEPSFSILEYWMAHALCGLNLATIERWITPPARSEIDSRIALIATYLQDEARKKKEQSLNALKCSLPPVHLKLQSCSAATKKKAMTQSKAKNGSAGPKYKSIPLFIG